MSTTIDFNLMIEEMYKDEPHIYQIVGRVLRSICKKFIFQLQEDIELNVRYFHVRCRYIQENAQTDVLQLLISRLNLVGVSYLHSSDFSYVMTETPIAGPWKDSDFEENDKFVYTPLEQKDITYDTLYPFQKSLYDMSNSFDHRAIDVIYDPLGGNGKTVISNYLVDNNNCYILQNCHNYQEILIDAYNHAIALLSQFGDGHNSRCRNIKAMIIDLSGVHDQITRLIISAVETIKRGRLFDHRYSYKIHRIEPPRVFIFCRKIPELSFLSEDFVKIWTIENKKLVPYTVPS